MRVCLLARRFDPGGGGTERDLMITADCLRRAGHEVMVYAGELRGRWDDYPVRLVRTGFPGRSLRLLHFAFVAPMAARRGGADLVISFARTVDADVLRSGGGAHSSYLKAARAWRGPAASAAMRLSPYHRTQMFIERRGFASSWLKMVLAVSNLVRDDLIREFALGPQKVITLYNGVDLERFRPAPDETVRGRIRREIGLAGLAPVVIFVGNGFARKGLDFLLEAWPRVPAEARLIVAGRDRGSEAYRRRARRLGIADRVLFLGPRSDIDRLFHAAEALALPSLFEPFGNVVMEAMASGLPVLTSACSGVAELLPDELKRFTVMNPSDPAEIAVRLDALIAARSDLGTLARATAEQFTWERYGEELLHILARVSSV